MRSRTTTIWLQSIGLVDVTQGWAGPGTIVFGFDRALQGAKKRKNYKKTETSSFSQKLFFSQFRLIFGRSGSVRGGGHGPYEEIPSIFGRVWSYRTWRKSIFMFFGNLGNSLHHQILPNWSSGLHIGTWIFFNARVPSQELSNKLMFPKMTPNKNMFWGTGQPSQN